MLCCCLNFWSVTAAELAADAAVAVAGAVRIAICSTQLHAAVENGQQLGKQPVLECLLPAGHLARLHMCMVHHTIHNNDLSYVAGS